MIKAYRMDVLHDKPGVAAGANSLLKKGDG
jgi:hypothetical protein